MLDSMVRQFAYVSRNAAPRAVRYTFKTVRRVIPVVFVILSAIPHLMAADESFSRVKVPDSKGKPVNAVLTFSDQNQAVEIRPTKVPG